MEPPIIEIFNPSTSPYASTSPRGYIKARVRNVSDQRNISMTVNGQQRDFTYNNGNLTAHFPLRTGRNEVWLTAQNRTGEARESVIITYKDDSNPTTGVHPTVDITTPSGNRYTSQYPTMNIRAQLREVASKDDIDLRINGNRQYRFSYNERTGIMEAEVDLQTGENTIKVTGKNRAGSASDQVTIIYEKAGDSRR